MNEKILREAIRAILAEKTELALNTKALLQKIDDGPYHMTPVDELEGDEREAAEVLVMRGLLKHLPANSRFPERYVVSAAGSHATGTFDMDTFHDERPEIRRAQRNGTIKTKKW